MPVATMPPSLREAWGEKVTQDMATWVEEVLEERTVVRDEYRQVLSRLDGLERDVTVLQSDVAALKGDVSELRTDVRDLRREVNERFDRVHERLSDMEGRLHERLDTMYERMLVHTRWTVGTIALFGTLITILLAIAQFVKP